MCKNNIEWNGFKGIGFEFENRAATVVFPEHMNGKWLFKMEYLDAFPQFEIEMLKRGWTLVFIKNITRWCLDEDLDLKARLAEHISKEYNLNPKCVPVGLSCGGMFAVKFAAKYPKLVSCMYLDAPVLNLLSCPADLGVGKSEMLEEFTQATGITKSELICYRKHPMDYFPVLLENNIPIILVYGKDDEIVPYCENGAILESFYKDNGGVLELIGKDNCGHHPHGLENPVKIIEFVEKHYIKGGESQ